MREINAPQDFELNSEGDVITLYDRRIPADPFLEPAHPGYIELPASPRTWSEIWGPISDAIFHLSMFLLAASMFCISVVAMALLVGGLMGWIE